MTRTAAEVQAEIDALKEADFKRAEMYFGVEYVAGVTGQRHSPEHWVWQAAEVAALDARHEQLRNLEAERDRLKREELEAATPPKVRLRASQMRATFYAAGGTVMGGANHAWEALETHDAAAWAAVAREAGR